MSNEENEVTYNLRYASEVGAELYLLKDIEDAPIEFNFADAQTMARRIVLTGGFAETISNTGEVKTYKPWFDVTE